MKTFCPLVNITGSNDELSRWCRREKCGFWDDCRSGCGLSFIGREKTLFPSEEDKRECNNATDKH